MSCRFANDPLMMTLLVEVWDDSASEAPGSAERTL